MTEAQKDDLKRLAAKPDDQIDTGDIPELTDAQLAEMRRPEHYRPLKKQITARLADEVKALSLTGEEIASQLQMAPKTVENHVRQLLRKADVENSQ